MTVTQVQPPKDTSIEDLHAYLAACASVVRNKDPKDNSKLWERLLVESYGNTPSRMFEFIPCKVLLRDISYTKDQLFGFTDEERRWYYTNLREVLTYDAANNDYGILNIPHCIDFTDYFVVKITAPFFIYSHLSTHTQITSVSHSARYTAADLGYYKPEEVLMGQEEWDAYVKCNSPIALEAYMKSCGIIRREIFARGADMLAYRPFTLGGYISNPNAWPHFINQRTKDPHTQKETRIVAEEIAKLINKQFEQTASE